MKIIIYSSNFSPELTGIGKFNGELADRLSESGVDTHVITAPPYYPEWKRHSDFRNFWSRRKLPNGVTVHRSPIYVPNRVSLFSRLVHLLSFALSSIPNLLLFVFSRPDVVFVVQPSFLCAPATLLFCWLTGAKSIMHIQDFELDAMLGLGMSGGKKRWTLFKKFETFVMRRFDMVSSISYSMLNKAREKGVDDDRLVFFPNWADTSALNPNVSGDTMRVEWNVRAHERVILYSGNIGNKQGLEAIIEMADALREQPELRFFIVGTGTNKKRLEKIASDRQLTNLEFKPLQPYEKLPQMLAMADVHLVLQRKGAADAVLPSKLTAILASGGHALVTAERDTELGQIARRFPGVYRLVEPENTELLTAAVQEILELKKLEPNIVARKYAVENLNVDKIVNRYIRNLIDLTKNVTEVTGKNHVE